MSNHPSLQKGILAACFVIGLLGTLGGVFLAVHADPASLAGLIGGAGMLTIAYFGLSRISLARGAGDNPGRTGTPGL